MAALRPGPSCGLMRGLAPTPRPRPGTPGAGEASLSPHRCTGSGRAALERGGGGDGARGTAAGRGGALPFLRGGRDDAGAPRGRLITPFLIRGQLGPAPGRVWLQVGPQAFQASPEDHRARARTAPRATGPPSRREPRTARAIAPLASPPPQQQSARGRGPCDRRNPPARRPAPPRPAPDPRPLVHRVRPPRPRARAARDGVRRRAAEGLPQHWRPHLLRWPQQGPPAGHRLAHRGDCDADALHGLAAHPVRPDRGLLLLLHAALHPGRAALHPLAARQAGAVARLQPPLGLQDLAGVLQLQVRRRARPPLRVTGPGAAWPPPAQRSERPARRRAGAAGDSRACSDTPLPIP
jgi:hypothetical protein